MQCPSCGFANPEDMSFCGKCGTSLSPSCPQCGFANPTDFAFCGKCGSRLAAQFAVKSKQAKRTPKLTQQAKRDKRSQGKAQVSKEPRRAASEAERRQLTVLFCDLVGSTALSERLDPEELREVVRAYHQVCAETIGRFEGHIAQYLGDGLLVYFGYPLAHEDDAQRAVRAGFGIVAAIQDAPLLRAHGVQVRLGIHTGPVVVGDIGTGMKREQLALGETPNLAARLQGLAEPSTVVISAATQRLIAGFFDCQDLGQQAVKGVSAPMQVYRVVAESRAQSRLEVDASTGKLTPLVGRAHEVGLILERWAAAQAGDGQVVLLTGEPGIGKSRLVQEVKERVVAQGATSIEFRCSPYFQNSALYPVLTHLQRLLLWQREDTPETKLAKLRQTLARYRFPQADILPLLALLLSLPQPADGPPLTFSPQKQKQKTQEALVAWLVEEAERRPVYCAWEDLHWADPSTLELLGLLLDQVPTARLLLLLTARPEFTLPLSSRTHLTPLTLARLPRTQAGEMIEKVTGGKPLPAEVQHQIVSKTDGVPLFVEELTKMVLESGLLRETDGRYELTGPLPPLAIPTTLHDSLMARLDRLAMVKEVAQLGATLGREFPYELLRAVAPVDEASLQQALGKLVEAEVLYQRGLPPQATYLFKHALIQDTAYQSLLKSTRQQYHRRIAQVLEERFAEITETQPELVAHHYTEAGLPVQAIPYWQRAGERATQRSAYVEAIAHFTKGLEVLQTLPATPERVQQQLTLQIALGGSLMATKGFAAPEVGSVYARARELCQQVGETPQLFSVLLGLRLFYMVRGEIHAACELGEQCLRLAQRVPEPALLLGAHHALGDTVYLTGELVSARVHQEQAIALYDPQQHRSLAESQGYDLGVDALAHGAWVLWYLGYPEQALHRSQAALILAREVSHLYSLAHAFWCAAWLHQLRQEVSAVQERAEAAITLSREHGFVQELAWGTIFRGWAVAKQGQREEGIAQMRQGLAAYQATGAQLEIPDYLALLADTYGDAGQPEEGLAVLAQAFTVMHATGERLCEAQLYRLKGELTLQSSLTNPQSEAEECFWKAIDIVRKQQAKSLELRAVMGLARLWQQQGKQKEARDLLVEIYGWFTEGFDTKDLQEAKALLEELT
jgi:class 3 adenylate cyclase/predicted ATPase